MAEINNCKIEQYKWLKLTTVKFNNIKLVTLPLFLHVKLHLKP